MPRARSISSMNSAGGSQGRDVSASFGDHSRETIDLIGSTPARMPRVEMDVRGGALSIRPFQVSRWRWRRTRHLWVFNGVLVLGYGLERAFLKRRRVYLGHEAYRRLLERGSRIADCPVPSEPRPVLRKMVFRLRRVPSRPRASFARAGGKP